MELLHLAESIGPAELWIAKDCYRTPRLEIVSDDVSVSGAGKADIADCALLKTRGARCSRISP